MNEANTIDTDALKRVYDEALERIRKDGALTLSEMKGMTEGEVESIYAVGYNLASVGKYEDAVKVFRGLVMLDHLEKKHWYGLGAVYQQLRDFEKASQAYRVCMFLDFFDPKPEFHCAECCLALGDEASALGLLDVIEENAARPEFKAEAESAEYLARARKLREEIRSGGKAGR